MPTINGVTISGIDESEFFYYNNPILIKISSAGDFKKADIKLINNTKITQRDSALFVLYPNRDNEILIDLSYYIKSVETEFNSYNTFYRWENIPRTNQNCNILINVYVGSQVVSFSFDKTFYKGWINDLKTNQIVSDLSLMTLMNVPFYDMPGYTNYYNRHDANAFPAEFVKSKSSQNIKNIILLNNTCSNYTLFKFVNSRGGYSYIFSNDLIKSSQIEVGTDQLVKRYNFNQKVIETNDKKVSPEINYNANFELNNRFKDFVNEFVLSPYVEVRINNVWYIVDLQNHTSPSTYNNSVELIYQFKVLNSVNI